MATPITPSNPESDREAKKTLKQLHNTLISMMKHDEEFLDLYEDHAKRQQTYLNKAFQNHDRRFFKQHEMYFTDLNKQLKAQFNTVNINTRRDIVNEAKRTKSYWEETYKVQKQFEQLYKDKQRELTKENINAKKSAAEAMRKQSFVRNPAEKIKEAISGLFSRKVITPLGQWFDKSADKLISKGKIGKAIGQELKYLYKPMQLDWEAEVKQRQLDAREREAMIERYKDFEAAEVKNDRIKKDVEQLLKIRTQAEKEGSLDKTMQDELKSNATFKEIMGRRDTELQNAFLQLTAQVQTMKDAGADNADIFQVIEQRLTKLNVDKKDIEKLTQTLDATGKITQGDLQSILTKTLDQTATGNIAISQLSDLISQSKREMERLDANEIKFQRTREEILAKTEAQVGLSASILERTTALQDILLTMNKEKDDLYADIISEKLKTEAGVTDETDAARQERRTGGGTKYNNEIYNELVAIHREIELNTNKMLATLVGESKLSAINLGTGTDGLHAAVGGIVPESKSKHGTPVRVSEKGTGGELLLPLNKARMFLMPIIASLKPQKQTEVLAHIARKVDTIARVLTSNIQSGTGGSESSGENKLSRTLKTQLKRKLRKTAMDQIDKHVENKSLNKFLKQGTRSLTSTKPTGGRMSAMATRAPMGAGAGIGIGGGGGAGGLASLGTAGKVLLALGVAAAGTGAGYGINKVGNALSPGAGEGEKVGAKKSWNDAITNVATLGMGATDAKIGAAGKLTNADITKYNNENRRGKSQLASLDTKQSQKVDNIQREQTADVMKASETQTADVSKTFAEGTNQIVKAINNLRKDTAENRPILETHMPAKSYAPLTNKLSYAGF